MEWKNLLDSGRLNDPDYAEQPHRPIYVQDSDRVLFSAPFRRLANKTQVHPLYDNDHLHHRLIHSVETGSVGRSLGMAVGHWLEQSSHIEPGQKHAVSGIVQAACLAHDIGNPPFGHSGEAAIGEWFAERFAQSAGLFGRMDDPRRAEFISFEGNAQGFRILTRLEMYRDQGGMRISHGVLGAFSKYPITAWVQQEVKAVYCGSKKFGIFQAELDIFKTVAEKTGLAQEQAVRGTWWRRHPLVFLVEAADDICYGILDVEDAFISGDIPAEAVLEVLESLAGKPNKDFSAVRSDEKISYARARGIGAAIDACVESFKENYQSLMDGTFNGSLLETSAKAAEFRAVKEIAKQKIFTTRRKTELEVLGRNVIHQVLDGVVPVYTALQDAGWQYNALSGYNQQLARALQLDFRGVQDAYSALHAITDYVSGMTDRYAVRVAKMLGGVG